MQVFLETQRRVLRQFAMADADALVDLDADPHGMRYVTGGVPTSREKIETEVLPAFLGYYQRYEGFGFWAAVEKATGNSRLAGPRSGTRTRSPGGGRTPGRS